MEKKKISLTTFIICMLIMISVIIFLGGYVVKLKNITNEQNVENNEIKIENNEEYEKKEIAVIEEVSHIEIEIDNSNETELSYTEPLKVEDKEVINKIIKIVNKYKDIEIKKSGGFFESCPIVTIYKVDGTKVKVIACDNFQMEGEPSGNIVGIYTKEDASDKEIYQIDEELGKYIEEVYCNSKKEFSKKLSHEDITNDI